jgi:hypothetical protein
MLLEYAYTPACPASRDRKRGAPAVREHASSVADRCPGRTLSVERYSVRLVLQITLMRLPSGAGHGCAEASWPALLRTMLHTEKP